MLKGVIRRELAALLGASTLAPPFRAQTHQNTPVAPYSPCSTGAEALDYFFLGLYSTNNSGNCFLSAAIFGTSQT
jgi:hypothetical protein